MGGLQFHRQNDYEIEILRSLLLSANKIYAVWNLGILFLREKLRSFVILSGNVAPQVVTPVWLVYRLATPDYRKFKLAMPVYQIQNMNKWNFRNWNWMKCGWLGR